MADDDKTKSSDASGSSEGGSTSGSGEGAGSSSSSGVEVVEKPTPLIPDGNIESYTNMYRFAEAVNDLMTNGKTAKRLRSDPTTVADMECFTPGHTLHLSDLINVVYKHQELFSFSKRMSTNELVSLYNYGKTIAREGRKFPSTDDVNEAVKSYEDKKRLAITEAEKNYAGKCKGYNESKKVQSKAGWKVFGHTFGVIGSGALALTVPAAVFGGLVALVTVPSVAIGWMTGGSIALFAGAVVAVKYVMPKCFQLFQKAFGKLKDAIKAHKEARKCTKESRLIRNDARAQYSACQNQYVIDNNLSSISTKCYPGHVRTGESERTAEADPVLIPTGYERVSDARTSSAPASEAGGTTAPDVEAERTIETSEGASGTGGKTSTATAGTESTSSAGGAPATATAGTGSVGATPETASETADTTSTATAETGSSELASDSETAELTADESAIWHDFEKSYESVEDKRRIVEESAFINTAIEKGIEEKRAREIFNIKRPETKLTSVTPTGGDGSTTSDLTVEAESAKPQTQTKPVPPTGGNGGGNNNHDDEEEHENVDNGGNDGGGSGGDNGGNNGGNNEGEEESENTQTPEGDAKTPKHDCPYLAIQCFDSIEGTPTEEQINAIYARTGYKSLDDAKAKYAKNKKISVEEIDLDPKEGKKPNRPWLAKTIAEVVGKDNLSKTYETRTGYSDPEVAKQVYAKQKFRKANKEVLTSLGTSSWKELSSKSEEETEKLWENLDKKQKDNLLDTVKDLSDEDAEALLRDIPEGIVKGVRSRLETEQTVEEEHDSSTSVENSETAIDEPTVVAEEGATAPEEPDVVEEGVSEEELKAKSAESSEMKDSAELGKSVEDDVYDRFISSGKGSNVVYASEEQKINTFIGFAALAGHISPERAREIYEERSKSQEPDSVQKSDSYTLDDILSEMGPEVSGNFQLFEISEQGKELVEQLKEAIAGYMARGGKNYTESDNKLDAYNLVQKFYDTHVKPKEVDVDEAFVKAGRVSTEQTQPVEPTETDKTSLDEPDEAVEETQSVEETQGEPVEEDQSTAEEQSEPVEEAQSADETQGEPVEEEKSADETQSEQDKEGSVRAEDYSVVKDGRAETDKSKTGSESKKPANGNASETEGPEPGDE